MSVIIKGMEIPESCFDCAFRSPLFIPDEVYFCNCSVEPNGLDITQAVEEDYRHPDCPLVEVPTPHGRLIDADELKKEYPHDEDWEYPVNTNEYVSESIDNALTVIDAEGEEHEEKERKLL